MQLFIIYKYNLLPNAILTINYTLLFQTGFQRPSPYMCFSMYGSNGPCSPTEYLPQYSSILEPIYYPTGRDTTFCQNTAMTFESDPECHNSAPPTPDVISGLVSLTPGQYCSSEISSGSFGDLTSPDEYQSTTSSPPSYSVDIPKVQATRTKLIKEGLKLTIQSRRMVHGLDNVKLDYRPPRREEVSYSQLY